ncbi:FtsX-like permease family protein [Ornithinimicrobium cavernae]|uniref:FtsX-like permease family protein n=1 Tax=Ornithinimicrobium cavernae TaxID=2666047 RepID=UPI000D69CF23|nr:FtsX-like permease family protein [Ornithinimicrobium cavernae]
MAGARGWMTAGMASKGRRLVSAAVVIVIGVAFLTTSLAAMVTMQRGLQDAVGAGLREAGVVVTGTDNSWIGAETFDDLAALPELTDVRGATNVSAQLGPEEWVMGASVPLGGLTLTDGAAVGEDSRVGEVVVNQILAEDVAVGDELTVTTVPAEPGEPGTPVTLNVVGVASFDEATSALAFGPGFVAADATLRSIDPQLSYEALIADVAPGADEAAAREAVAQAWSSAVVQTGPEAAAERVAQLTGGTDILAGILLGFGAVALATAAIVIANTFTITLAQRTGELALLRAVGATKRQVRGLVLFEALVLGLVASAVGVCVGLLGGQGLLVLAGRFDLGIPLADRIAITPLMLLLPLAVGTAMTVLAGLWPAARATRVSPLAALRPAGQASDRRRISGVRLVAAILLVGTGGAAMAYAATNRDMISGVVGGLVSFVGVLLAAVVIVPAAVRALGLLARATGVPGRLAVDNAVRNPGRAAATSAALLVGVTLITMTSIGAASGERTAIGEIDAAYAVDFVAETGGEYLEETGTPADDVDGAGSGEESEAPTTVPLPLGRDTDTRLGAVDGVEAARAVDTAYLDLDESWASTLTLGLDPARDGDVVRSPALQQLVPGTIGLSRDMLNIHGLEPGATIPVHGPGGTRELRIVELAVGYNLALHVTDLQTLGGDSVVPGAVLVRLAEDVDLADTLAGIQEVADKESLTLSGSAMDRAVITQMLDVLVLVTTALLGVAVLIAVVGIANTLALSVLERTRENALLRALGLTRLQLRGMLTVEGVLLAVVSALLGIVLGVTYAWLGVQTLMPEDTEAVLAFPVTRLSVILAVAIAAGVLASVLPARRAARTAPAAGLAAV